MPDKPPFIQAPADRSGEEFRLDCLAWHLFTSKDPTELSDYLKHKKHLNTDAFTSRIERCRAWWMLTNLNRAQIEADLMAMGQQHEASMRGHLNQVREQMKNLRGEAI